MSWCANRHFVRLSHTVCLFVCLLWGFFILNLQLGHEAQPLNILLSSVSLCVVRDVTSILRNNGCKFIVFDIFMCLL